MKVSEQDLGNSSWEALALLVRVLSYCLSKSIEEATNHGAKFYEDGDKSDR
jgi:hypothetical protein